MSKSKYRKLVKCKKCGAKPDDPCIDTGEGIISINHYPGREMKWKHEEAWQTTAPKKGVDPDSPFDWPNGIRTKFRADREGLNRLGLSSDCPAPAELAGSSEKALCLTLGRGVKFRYVKGVLSAAGIRLKLGWGYE